MQANGPGPDYGNHICRFISAGCRGCRVWNKREKAPDSGVMPLASHTPIAGMALQAHPWSVDAANWITSVYCITISWSKFTDTTRREFKVTQFPSTLRFAYISTTLRLTIGISLSLPSSCALVAHCRRQAPWWWYVHAWRLVTHSYIFQTVYPN